MRSADAGGPAWGGGMGGLAGRGDTPKGAALTRPTSPVPSVLPLGPGCAQQTVQQKTLSPLLRTGKISL